MKPKYQTLIDSFKTHRPLINIVLDGYGLGKKDHTDGIFQAKTPFMDFLFKNYPNTQLATHGKHVGLPNEKDLGGSEVGHITLGAGTIIAQGPAIIQQSIKDGSFYKSKVLQEAFKRSKNSALHLIGLLSDGGIHSNIHHSIAIIEEAVRQEIKTCYIHALLDGRDVGIQSAQEYVAILEKIFHEILQQHPDWEYGFASAGGRETMTMDRDKNWTKIELGWKCHVEGKSDHQFSSMIEGIEYFRKKNPNLVDQDIPPFNIFNSENKIPTIQDGDAVIFTNFRGDRAIELSRAFTEENFDAFPISHRPKVYFAGMMTYDEDTNLPANKIIESSKVKNPFGKRILELGLKQFRLTETQKFAHVTFFFNGGYRNPLDPNMETYHLIDSDKVPSFAEAPAMKAFEIAKQATLFLESKQYDYGLINFANADMVGHTGDMNAVISSIHSLDQALQKVCEAIKKVNGIAIITADHGNADEMLVINKKNIEEPSTKHSLNLVPCILYDPLFENNYQLKQFTLEKPLNLSMIAATNYVLFGKQPPSDLNDILFDI